MIPPDERPTTAPLLKHVQPTPRPIRKTTSKHMYSAPTTASEAYSLSVTTGVRSDTPSPTKAIPIQKTAIASSAVPEIPIQQFTPPVPPLKKLTSTVESKHPAAFDPHVDAGLPLEAVSYTQRAHSAPAEVANTETRSTPVKSDVLPPFTDEMQPSSQQTTVTTPIPLQNTTSQPSGTTPSSTTPSGITPSDITP